MRYGEKSCRGCEWLSETTDRTGKPTFFQCYNTNNGVWYGRIIEQAKIEHKDSVSILTPMWCVKMKD